MKRLIIYFIVVAGLLSEANAQSQNLNQSNFGDTCLDKKYSIVFYLIQDSLFSMPTNTAAVAGYSLPLIMNILNKAFKPICVSFEHCKTEIIPNWSYNKWTAATVGNQVISQYYHENTINVYLPTEMLSLYPDDPERSYTYLPATGTATTRDAIVITKMMSVDSSLTNGFRGGALLHVFGHYFGLPHTFEGFTGTSPGPELVRRDSQGNCHTHGDKFCDTPADPWPFNGSGISSGTNCGGNSAVDANGDFYRPPYNNIMSVYECRCRFTSEQYRAMVKFMITKRKYLH